MASGGPSPYGSKPRELRALRLHPGQQILDLDIGSAPSAEPETASRSSSSIGGTQVVSTRSELLWNTLEDA
ncbi:hypothetical protein HNR07_006868 [Nocardiopsis metallicus]|uniref:Uncharacterized protein n=1 Tax=Nocardiopsis metallicus TaxID=179819 RepID=A0A840WRS7_9ACTN|nr:hypothetical protein [Nocardiopsis metallicus]